MTSEISRRAALLVEARLPAARALGAQLGDLIDDPETFVRSARSGMTELADDEYAAVQDRVAPGSGPTIGVRWPLVHALERELRRALRESSADSVLSLAQRLVSEPQREIRLLALPCLKRTLPGDPERSWQLMRRLARGANDWISVNSLAEVFAIGVLAERFRWAELEQLVYSDHRMERRLVGSTLARIPHEVPHARRGMLQIGAALELIGQLMGDADDQVRKALSWALREWSRVDTVVVGAWLDTQATLAAATADGHRAWVIRDALPAQPAATAAAIRARLEGIRRRPGAPSTSLADQAARRFGMAASTDRAVAQQGERYVGNRA